MRLAQTLRRVGFMPKGYSLAGLRAQAIRCCAWDRHVDNGDRRSSSPRLRAGRSGSASPASAASTPKCSAPILDAAQLPNRARDGGRPSPRVA